MKLRLKASGEIWDVDYISATNKDGLAGNFYGGYELIPDEPPKPSATDAELNRVTAWVTEISKQVNLQGSDIRRLTDILKRVTDLESERALIAEVIQSHGVELEEGLKMDLDILKRVESIELEYAKAKSWINTLESENQRIKHRLNAIEGLGIQR